MAGGGAGGGAGGSRPGLRPGPGRGSRWWVKRDRGGRFKAVAGAPAGGEQIAATPPQRCLTLEAKQGRPQLLLVGDRPDYPLASALSRWVSFSLSSLPWISWSSFESLLAPELGIVRMTDKRRKAVSHLLFVPPGARSAAAAPLVQACGLADASSTASGRLEARPLGPYEVAGGEQAGFLLRSQDKSPGLSWLERVVSWGGKGRSRQAGWPFCGGSPSIGSPATCAFSFVSPLLFWGDVLDKLLQCESFPRPGVLHTDGLGLGWWQVHHGSS